MTEQGAQSDIPNAHPAYGKISDEQFNSIAGYLSGKYGLRIPPEKKILLESRLIKRIAALNLPSIEAYISHVFKPENAHTEYPLFIDHITTHKTFFFRENYQFEYLKAALPNYIDAHNRKTIKVWSAGCSTGEEVYSLGIVLHQLREEVTHFDYRITGTDVSVPSLKAAASGVFTTELGFIPENVKTKFFTRIPYRSGEALKFSHAEVINRINLGVLNLNGKHYNLPAMFDFIFCRNVIIYFDAKTRAAVLEKMVSWLKPGGYLFLGHSETALGTSLPLKSLKPTIYQKAI